MPIPTKEKLAMKLHALGFIDLENRARLGEFSDFEGNSATPKVRLVRELEKLRDPKHYPPGVHEPILNTFIQEVINGEWDDSKEEGDAWFEREGKNLIS